MLYLNLVNLKVQFVFLFVVVLASNQVLVV